MLYAGPSCSVKVQ